MGMNRLFGFGTSKGRTDVMLTVGEDQSLTIAPTGGSVLLTTPSGKEIPIKAGDTFTLTNMTDSTLTVQGVGSGP